MSITYIFEDLTEVARHLEERARGIREAPRARSARQRIAANVEAAAYESVADMLRNTKLGEDQ